MKLATEDQVHGHKTVEDLLACWSQHCKAYGLFFELSGPFTPLSASKSQRAALKITIATQPTLRMFKVNGGPPWVIAKDPADALEILLNDDNGTDRYAVNDIVQMPDDEKFTMTYDDQPEGLTPNCPHPYNDDEGSYCNDCDEDRHSVTLTCAQWAALGDKHRDRVIWSFQDL